MRNVTLAIYVSLDGVVDEPAWTGPFSSDDLATLQKDLLFASDALLLGRVTYQGFAAAWPSMTDEEGFADRMYSLPKFVATTTLDHAEWNATLMKGERGGAGGGPEGAARPGPLALRQSSAGRHAHPGRAHRPL